MDTQKIISKDNRAVVINVQECEGEVSVWANLYVNARNGIENAEITLTHFDGKTLKGAEKWAKKVLARY